MSLELSVVIPVCNEEGLIVAAVAELRAELSSLGLGYEIILAENGSTDRTRAVAEELAREHADVVVFSYPEPNYGASLKEGIFRARGTFVICEELDILDPDFHGQALELLRSGRADMVIGSKSMPGSDDRRPVGRRVATRLYNRILRLAFAFPGTDTHGIKGFLRAAMVPVVDACAVDHDVFASEMVIRAHRQGLRVVEIPVSIREKRAPSLHLVRRVPRVVVRLARLALSLDACPCADDPLDGRTRDPHPG